MSLTAYSHAVNNVVINLGWPGPGSLLKQQMGIGRPEGLQLWQSQEQKHGCGEESGEAMEKDFSVSLKGGSGKLSDSSGRESRAWPSAQL